MSATEFRDVIAKLNDKEDEVKDLKEKEKHYVEQIEDLKKEILNINMCEEK